jgi:hypothetical protein
MTRGIVHHQRVAWDCARAFVALADSDREYFWLSTRLADLLGADYGLALSDTRTRLLWQSRGDAVNIESGLWRARIQDLLDQRPEISLALEALMYDAKARATEPYAISG